MVNRNNIQVLFDELSIEKINAFMIDSGWQASASENPDVCAFEKMQDGENHRIWIWKSKSHPKFRSRVQNLVFSFAVKNGKEPIEIANSIYNTSITKGKSSTSQSEDDNAGSGNADQSLRFRVVNDRPHATSLVVTDLWGESWSLDSMQGIEVFVDDSNFSVPTISVSENEIRVSADKPNSVRVFISGMVSESVELSELVKNSFDRMDSLDCYGYIESELTPVQSRASFELSDLGKSTGFENYVCKSTATFLTALTNLIPETLDKAQDIIWHVCCGILARSGLLLEISPNAIQDLFVTAKQDDEMAPVGTLEWLKIHTIVN